jgi:glucose/arabinose dehydrogenase
MKRIGIWIMIILVATIAPAYAQDESGASDEEFPVTTRDALPDTSQFRLVEVAGGFATPIYLTNAGDGSGRLFVVEQPGRIWIVKDGQKSAAPFLDISGLVSQDVLGGYSERGLLGLAFHPDYEENGLFYVNYTDRNGDTHIVEYMVSAENPDVANPNSARELLFVSQPYSTHNGGQLAFGFDGYLYIAFGDGGSRDDPGGNGQNPGVLLGKILRIDVDDWDFDHPYGIPADNPFSTNPALAPEVWAWGLRNAWRFSFDRATGDLYIADVGQNQYEEINFQSVDSAGGENYGWNRYEATHRYLGAEPATPVVMPIAEYSHGEGCSVTGGYVYRGDLVPELTAAYFYGDYCSGNVWGAYRDPNGDWRSGILFDAQMSISSFGEGDDGELYVLNYVRGTVLRFEPRPA